MEIRKAVVALGALAQETRLKIFKLLVRAGKDGLPVGKIAESLGTQPNGRLSFHLKELVTTGLATSRQAGRYVYYSANYLAMNELLSYLTEHCCEGTPCGEFKATCNPETHQSNR